MKANLIFLTIIDTLQFWDYWKEQLFNVDTKAVLAKVAYIKILNESRFEHSRRNVLLILH